MAIKIYIDQGHNPVNPNAGAEGNGLREQDLVYDIGQRLAVLLRNDGNFEVKLSRPAPTTQLGTSNTTSLAARVNEANYWGANYFISLHTNASDIPSASGSEAFVYSRNSESFVFGQYILSGLNQTTGLADRGVFSRPGFYILRKTQMPAVLVELGFITNAQEAELMSQSPQLFANGIYEGILDFFDLD